MKKICLICGKEFTSIYSYQKYHKRCAKEANRRNARERYKPSETTFPEYHCPECGHYTQLDFEPKSSPLKWRNLICKHCGTKKENEALDKPSSKGVESNSVNRKIKTLPNLERFEDYKHCIKNTCVICGRDIPGDWQWYRARGNYCDDCLGRIKRNIRKEIGKEERTLMEEILMSKLSMSKKAIAQRKYRRKNLEKIRAYNKEYMRKWRLNKKKLV